MAKKLSTVGVASPAWIEWLTKSLFLKDWAKAGQIAIKPGIGNGKAQIIITAAKKEFTGEEIDEMFSYG